MKWSNNVLYSTGCPRCNVLKKKLDDSGIQYDLVTDEDVMVNLGFKTTPMLKVDDNYYDFTEAIAWVRSM